SDPDEPHGGEVDAALPQREEVGQGLARVFEVAQRVDHRHRRVAGQALHGLVRVHARSDPVHPERENARGIGHRLARAEAALGAGKVDRAAAQLDDSDLEGHPRSERWLLEDQREGPPAQRRAAPAGFPALLERGRDAEEVLRPLAAQIRRREEVAHGWLGARARSTAARARSQSRSSAISGGANRITLSPALRMSTPASRQASTMGAAATVSSAPMSRPRPLTARTTGCFVAKRRRPSIRYRPILAARSGIFSSSTVVKLAIATAVTNGLPPNVVPCVPGVSTLPTSRVASVAPMGRPFASALATVMMSGSTPLCS